jgi:hypothetical protein
MFNPNTAPVSECIDYITNCLHKAQTAGDELAQAKFEIMLWAYETEAETGIFPTAELNRKLSTQLN